MSNPLPIPPDILARGRARAFSAPALQHDADGRRIPPARMVQIYPPEIYPIPSARDLFQIAKTLVLPAGAASTVTSAAVELQLPTGNVAVIRVVEIFIDAPTALADIDFTLFINRAPVAGFDRLSFFPRAASSLSKPFEGILRVPNGSFINMVATNRSAAGPWTVGMSFGGWSWPELDGEVYTGLTYGRI